MAHLVSKVPDKLKRKRITAPALAAALRQQQPEHTLSRQTCYQLAAGKVPTQERAIVALCLFFDCHPGDLVALVK